MNERVVQFRVGVMVLASIILAAIMVVLIDGFPRVGKGPYTVYLAFFKAPGVAAGTPVRKNGILIGRVTKVEFAEDRDLKMDGGGVVITAEIDANRRLHRNETVMITKSLLGDAVIEFVPVRSQNKPNDYLDNGDVVFGEVSPDPLQAIAGLEGNLSIAIGSIAKTSDEIGVLARRFNGLLATNDDQLARMLSKAEGSLDQIQSLVRNTDELIGDPELRANVRQVANDLPQALADMREAMGSMKQTFEAADRNLRNMEGLTRPLGENGERLIANIERATTTLDQVLQDVSQFSTRLNSPDGSIGRLLNDPQLYNELNDAVQNISGLTEELRPILSDARVISDKFARHPEKLGVRGLVFPSSGIK